MSARINEPPPGCDTLTADSVQLRDTITQLKTEIYALK